MEPLHDEDGNECRRVSVSVDVSQSLLLPLELLYWHELARPLLVGLSLQLHRSVAVAAPVDSALAAVAVVAVPAPDPFHATIHQSNSCLYTCANVQCNGVA